jgi:hypothetical protein
MAGERKTDLTIRITEAAVVAPGLQEQVVRLQATEAMACKVQSPALQRITLVAVQEQGNLVLPEALLLALAAKAAAGAVLLVLAAWQIPAVAV